MNKVFNLLLGFCDLGRAFDVVDHKIILNELFKLEIRLILVFPCLTNCFPLVFSCVPYVEIDQDLNTYRSEYFQVQIVVPQGFVLGPLLILIISMIFLLS